MSVFIGSFIVLSFVVSLLLFLNVNTKYDTWLGGALIVLIITAIIYAVIVQEPPVGCAPNDYGCIYNEMTDCEKLAFEKRLCQYGEKRACGNIRYLLLKCKNEDI